MQDPFLQRQATEDLRLIAGILEPLKCPVALVFGNHDHPALFRKVFDRLSQNQMVDSYQVLTFLDSEGSDNVPQREGNEQKRFTDMLSGAAIQPQIHIQHYVVCPEMNEGYPHSYGEGESMHRDIVSSGAVRLVLSGHYHRGIEPFFDKGVWFATVPAFVEFPHPYWVYELSGDSLTWTQHVVDSPR